MLRDFLAKLLPAFFAGAQVYAASKGIDISSIRQAVRNAIDAEIEDEATAGAVNHSVEVLLAPVYERLEELERLVKTANPNA